MTVNRRPALIAGFLIAACLAPEATAQSRPAQESYSDRYSVLSQRNIFLRDRRSSSGRGELTSRPASAPRPPEEAFILTGIVYEDNDFQAFIEDTNAGSVLKLRIGDAISRGRISQMHIDAIEYEHSGRRDWIDVGQRLTGEVISAGAVSSTQPSAPIDPNDPNLTMEQKMRLRRQQELNRK